MKKGLIVAIIFLFSISLAYAANCGGAVNCSCGDIINESFVMTGDLSCSGTALTIGANDITLDCDGNTITGDGSGNGVEADTIDNSTIKNCIINEFNQGIEIENTDNSNIINNKIENSTWMGILVSDSNLNYIYKNEVLDNNIGGTPDNSFTRNNGLDLQNSSHNTIENNTLYKNTNLGLHIENSENNTVINNNLTLNFNHGGVIETSDENNITENTIKNNTDIGLIVFKSDNNYIYNNSVTDNDRGLAIETADNNEIIKNQIFSNNQMGIRVFVNAFNNNIKQNQIFNNNNGIESQSADRQIINNNSIYNNQNLGIYLFAAHDNIITNNIIENNTNLGLRLRNADDNNITYNTFYDNPTEILVEFFSFGNNITLNNISNSITINLSQDGSLSAENNNFSLYTATDIGNTIVDAFTSTAFDGFVDFCPYLNDTLSSEGDEIVVSSELNGTRYYACCDEPSDCPDTDSTCIENGTIVGDAECIDGEWDEGMGPGGDEDPPEILNTKPSGTVMHQEAIIYVETNENSTCYYDDKLFKYTSNTRYHETNVNAEEGSNSFDIDCFDTADNEGTGTVSFSYDPDASISTDSVGDIEANASSIVIIASFDAGIADLRSSQFKLYLDNKETEIAIIDTDGTGTYNISFIAPEKEGEYEIELEIRGAGTAEGTLTVQSESMFIILDEAFDTTKDNIAYVKEADHIIGIASQGKDVSIDTSALRTNLADGTIYVFMTKTKSDPKKIDRVLKRQEFEEEQSSFGYGIKKGSYTAYNSLRYDDIQITGDDFIGEGSHNMLIKNKGVNATTGRIIIEVKAL